MGKAICNNSVINGLSYNITITNSEKTINYTITGFRSQINCSLALYANDRLNEIQTELYICK